MARIIKIDTFPATVRHLEVGDIIRFEDGGYEIIEINEFGDDKFMITFSDGEIVEKFGSDHLMMVIK